MHKYEGNIAKVKINVIYLQHMINIVEDFSAIQSYNNIIIYNISTQSINKMYK